MCCVRTLSIKQTPTTLTNDPTMATVWVHFGDGGKMMSTFRKGQKTPFFRVGICSGGQHDREEMYHFINEVAWMHWSGKDANPTNYDGGKFPRDSPFRYMVGTYHCADAEGSVASLVKNSSDERDSVM
jgi:hypothetical protein